MHKHTLHAWQQCWNKFQGLWLCSCICSLLPTNLLLGLHLLLQHSSFAQTQNFSTQSGIFLGPWGWIMFSASFENKMFKCVYRYQFQVYRSTDTFPKDSSPAFSPWGQLPLSGEYWLILESWTSLLAGLCWRKKSVATFPHLLHQNQNYFLRSAREFKPQVLNSPLYKTLVRFFGLFQGCGKICQWS